MYKKIFSVILAVILVATSISVLSLCVTAETLAAGSYPYAANGTKAPIIKSSTTGEVNTADGFLTKLSVDSLTNENFTSTFKPHMQATSNYVVNNKTLMATSLVDYSATADNVYGTSGKALKIAYTSATNGSITSADGVYQNMHCMRVTNSFNIPGEWKDTASVGFWVKTEYPVYITVRLSANSSGTESFIVSNRMFIPAGESFVEIPLSNFKTVNAGYKELNSGKISVYQTDIYFKAQESFTDTRDIYFDNIGYYGRYTTYKAVHDVGFKEIALNSSKLKTMTTSAPNTSVSVDANAAYSHSGYTNVAANTSAIKVEYSNMNSISDTAGKVRFYYDAYMRLNSEAPYIYGEDSVIAFWVRADQPMSLFIGYVDYDTASSGVKQSKTKTVEIPAGESIVKIKMSEMAPSGVTFDYRYANQFMITAKTNNYSIAGKTSGTIYFDAFGFYDESYEPPVVPDTKVTHADDFTEVALNSAKLKTLTSTPEAITLSYDANAAYSHSGSTNLAANTSAIKVEYAQMASTGYAVRFYYDAALRLNSQAPYIYGSDSVLSFWVRADQPMSLNYNYYDYDNNSSASKQSLGKTIEIPAGESIVKIKMSEMAPSGVDFDYRQAYQLMITIRTNDDSYKNNGVVYFDAFGFYDDSYQGGGSNPEQPESPVVPDTKVTHTDGFTEVELNTSKLKEFTSKAGTMSMSIDANAAYSHSGSTNLTANTTAIKIEYSEMSATANYVRFYYDNALRLNGTAPYIYDSDSVLAFWVRADQPMSLNYNYYDYDNNSSASKQSLGKTIEIPAGESIVKIKMSEMAPSGVDFDYRQAYQLMISARTNANSTKTSGVIYFDAFGFYDADPTNDIPEQPKPPVIPDTVVKHEIGFSEIIPNASKWITRKTDNVTITFEDNAAHYHQGKTNVAANTGALKVDYKNLSPSPANVSLYSESMIQLTNTAPYIYGDASVLSFWVFTDQSVDLTVTYMDYSNTDKKSVQCKKMNITLPVGESLVKIPMKDLVPDGHEMAYRYAYQLQFIVYPNSDTFTTSGTLYFDGLGFYDTNLVINDEPLTMPKNTFVWWDFNSGNDLDDVLGYWAARMAGVDGLGLQLELEKNAKNVYGGKGNSIKLTYNRALAKDNIPNFRNDLRLATSGDGVIFWVKSEERTTINLVAIDANGQTVVVRGIPVTIGYNIVNVKWSEFTFVDSKLTGKPDMSSIYQFQIRPAGASGTLWVDQIGFSNVKNDGSSAYNSIVPPNSYKGWYEGYVSNYEDFEKWPGDDDLGFCIDWYFDNKGEITLPKKNNNTYLQMNFDNSGGKASALINITEFKAVDPKGGISFWAKSSEKRYYNLRVVIGGQVAMITFMGDVNGRTYNIPFSAFWNNNRADKPFSLSSTAPVSITKLTFSSDGISNPSVASGISQKFTLLLDDIKFVDGKNFARAGLVDYTENGVNLKADEEAFSVGVFPKVTKTELTAEEKQNYIKVSGAKDVIAHYNINAYDINGKELIPQTVVILTFDVPKGVNASEIGLYQVYIDGSLSKRKVSITEDGKITAPVYRLGDYILTVESVKDSVADDNSTENETNTDESDFPWLIVVIIGASVLIIAAVIIIILIRKGRGK